MHLATIDIIVVIAYAIGIFILAQHAGELQHRGARGDPDPDRLLRHLVASPS